MRIFIYCLLLSFSAFIMFWMYSLLYVDYNLPKIPYAHFCAIALFINAAQTCWDADKIAERICDVTRNKR